MAIDWRAWRERSPRTFFFMVAAKRARTRVGLLLVVVILAERAYHSGVPLDPVRLNFPGVEALLLIAVGGAIRMAAYGCIRKKETLATGGVYSLCRHPLYLGSIVMTFGFCTLINDNIATLAALGYFLLFYPLTIAWEEIRLRERYGDAHCEYAKTTPLLLPFGRFRHQRFAFNLAVRNGGGALIAVTVLLLAVIEVLAELLPRR